MERVIILILFLVALAALFLALTAIARVEELEREIHRPKKKPGRMRDPTAIPDADLRRMAVQRKQHNNFMNYDGRSQDPIDENTILAESGK